MPRKPSWVWQYATVSEDRQDAICNICKESVTYDGSPSAITKHVTKKHALSGTVNDCQKSSNE